MVDKLSVFLVHFLMTVSNGISQGEAMILTEKYLNQFSQDEIINFMENHVYDKLRLKTEQLEIEAIEKERIELEKIRIETERLNAELLQREDLKNRLIEESLKPENLY